MESAPTSLAARSHADGDRPSWTPTATMFPSLARTRPTAATQDELVALIAHDLRSPLNIVLMATELMSAAATMDDAGRAHWLSVIRDAAENMNAMIGDVLDASRLQSGHTVLVLRPHALRPLLVEARHAHRPAADHAGVSLLIGVCAGDLVGRIDRAAMLRVLANLIENAIRFTPAGGHIVLDGVRDADEIRLWVRDTGTGIRPEHLPHVFDRFWQAGHQRRGSAGLGLTIVKALVEQHGGRVTVQSEPGSGTRFDLIFPLGANEHRVQF